MTGRQASCPGEYEYQHYCSGGAVDERKSLLIQTRSVADRIMEAFEQRLP